MPINKDLSDLPRPAGAEGIPPRVPRVVTRLAEAWLEAWNNQDEDHSQRILPEAGPYRGSFASIRCDRQLQYALRIEENPLPGRDDSTGADDLIARQQAWITEFGESDPDDVASVYRMAIGTMVHREFQNVMEQAFGDTWQSEVPIDLRPLGIPGSQRIDGVQDLNVPGDDPYVQNMRIPVELKTINGFGFKQAATTFKGPPAGPKSGHTLQLAYAIVALDAPYGILGYLSLENVGRSLTNKLYENPTPVQKFAAEWVISRELADILVEQEAKRINHVLGFKHGLVPRELHDPEVPNGAVVIDPSRGTWVVRMGGKVSQTGSTWMCDYCRQRTRCVGDGEGFIAPEVESF